MIGKVVVLGGGPAGLSVAWKLSEQGIATEVLEAEPYVGGLSHTMRHDGYLFDFGPHRFHSDNPAILAEIGRLVGDLPAKPRKTRVYFLGSYYDYPLSAGNLLKSMPPWLGLVCLSDFLATSIRNRLRRTPDDSFESWVVNRFGRRLYDIYFGPYTAKVWGRDPSQLSANWAAQRVAVVNLWDLVLRLVGLRRGYNSFHHSPYKPDFFYPREGVGLIYERMSEEIARNGGAVTLNARVEEVNCADGRIQSVTVQQDGRRRTVSGDYFVSTLPISPTVSMLQPQPPAEVMAAADAVRYRAMIFLFLKLDKEQVSDDHWIYFPQREMVFNRVSEMRNFTPDAAPAGRTSLTVEISCDAGDEIWNMPEDELLQRSIQGLVSAGLIRADQVLGHSFQRSLYAYPTYDLKFEFNVGRLAYHLAGLRNLIVCGRQGLFRYINQDHAIEMGFCAAEDILAQQLATRVGLVGTQQVYFG
ncbi:MAG: FAD-dependent oxidoreductase [Chloroflexota bacterium]